MWRWRLNDIRGWCIVTFGKQMGYSSEQEEVWKNKPGDIRERENVGIAVQDFVILTITLMCRQDLCGYYDMLLNI